LPITCAESTPLYKVIKRVIIKAILHLKVFIYVNPIENNTIIQYIYMGNKIIVILELRYQYAIC
jgi:hypothetical protein